MFIDIFINIFTNIFINIFITTTIVIRLYIFLFFSNISLRRAQEFGQSARIAAAADTSRRLLHAGPDAEATAPAMATPWALWKMGRGAPRGPAPYEK